MLHCLTAEASDSLNAAKAKLHNADTSKKCGVRPRAGAPLRLLAIAVPAVALAAVNWPEWASSAWSFLLLALGFSLVIFVHELGHFLAAKWAGVRVEQFAVGFGQAVLSYRKGIGVRTGSTVKEMNRRIDEYLVSRGRPHRGGPQSVTRVDQFDEFAVPRRGASSAANEKNEQGTGDETSSATSPERVAAAEALGIGETEYRVNWMPLGGYVKMLGQEDFVVDKSGELKVKADPRSFTSKTVGQRMVIISAGVIMNLIFAAIAFAVVVMVGRLQPPAVVGSVVQNSPAARAGLQPDDRILAVNGSEITSFGDLMASIVLSNQDEPLVLDVMREGRPLTPRPQVLPEFRKSESVRQLGIGQGMNRRIMVPSIGSKDEPADSELKANDELFKLVVGGEAKEFKDRGVFHRAMVEARGGPVDVIVRRPARPEDLTDEALASGQADVESSEVPVKIRALWMPVSHELGDTVTGSLLGLVPRLTIFAAEQNKSFDGAGVQFGDVITRIGNNDYPSYASLKATIEENPGRELGIEVRRPYAANHGLSGATVGFCARNREEFIAAARKDVKRAVQLVEKRAEESKLSQTERERLIQKLTEAGDAVGWRRWLERVDIHTLKPLVPKRPFSLLGKAPPPTIDALLHCVDENHLVVADVIDRIDGRTSAAKAAGIPVGSVILSVNGKPVKEWWELCEAFRAHAGQSVEVAYRVADEVRTTRMSIPMCIAAALDLGPGTRITKIDDRSSAEVKNLDGQLEEVALPDFRAVKAILESCKGRTVNVEYVTLQGRTGSGRFGVTESNVDPWLMRIMYGDSFICYQLWERHRVSNPILAAGVGFKQAYQATLQTIKSIQHMLITRKVGLDKVSGPVGIFRMGTKVADSGLLNLLWFLAVISANLAVLNFLPMPIVDGGLFLFLILEKIRGEPVSIRMQVATQVIGIALIATVFVLVTYQDIKNWILGA
jgi:membrane-associated protease RseP (regulator of RpoE activity)